MVSFLQKIFPGNSYEEPARALYEAIMLQSRQPVFYSDYGVPDTVEGRFDMLLLHCFLVLRRLKRDKKQTDQLSQTLFDYMVYDLDQSVRVSGVGDFKVGPRLKAMVEGFYGRIAAYEESLPKGREALSATLARNLYATADDPDPSQVLAVADYVERSAAALDRQALDEFLAGRVTFVPVAEAQSR